MKHKAKIYMVLLALVIVLFTARYSMAAVKEEANVSSKATVVSTENYVDVQYNPTKNEYENVPLTTHELTNTAAKYYREMGYNTEELKDPTREMLKSNLDGKVQLFATHGAVDRITFNYNNETVKNTTGIIIGDSREEPTGNIQYISVNDEGRKMWEANDTDLVTYIACNTAGNNDNFSTTSLTFQTVKYGRVKMAIGFKNKISYSSAKVWSKRFHEKLKEGEGVYDSMVYAGQDLSFVLFDYGNMNSWELVWDKNRVDKNTRIYDPLAGSLLPDPGIIILGMPKQNNILKRKIQIKNNDKEKTTIEYFKKYNSEFDINSYEIKKSNMRARSVDGSEIIEREFIYFIEKIGDFYINSGYIAEVENGEIISIIDDRINIDSEKKASIEQYKIAEKDSMKTVNQIEKQAIEKNQEREESVEATVDKTNIRYYYDIENDKKYMLVPYKEEIKDSDGVVSTLADTIMYEI